MQLLSHSHVELILNGHRFVGWSDEDPPYEMEREDAIDIKYGQDGGMYGLGMPSLAGVLTVKMQPASPTTQWLMQQEQLRQNAHVMRTAHRVYAGTLADSVQGVSWTLEGGVIQNIPHLRLAGQAFEAVFAFERVVSQVDGGVFHPPLASDAA